MKKVWKKAVGILTAAVVLSGEMNVCAATADVGQVSSFMENEFMLDDYVTTYTGKVPKNTPTKRIVRKEWYRTTDPNTRYLGKVYKYDAKGNITKILDGTDAAAGVIRINPSGGLSAKISKDGEYYKYDKKGNLVKRITKGPDGKAISWTVYDVDSDGKLNRATYYNQNGMYGYGDYTYKKGRIVKKNSGWYVNGGSKGTIKYKYNSDGNLTTVISENYKIKYTYDASGRLISTHTDRKDGSSDGTLFTYDSDGYLWRTTSEDAYNTTEYIYETVSPTHKTKKK